MKRSALSEKYYHDLDEWYFQHRTDVPPFRNDELLERVRIVLNRNNAAIHSDDTGTPEVEVIALLTEINGGSSSDTYISFTKLAKASIDVLPTYRRAKKYLDDHPEIRRRELPQRLEVHAGDWFQSTSKLKRPKKSVDEPTAHELAEQAKRLAEIKRKQGR